MKTTSLCAAGIVGAFLFALGFAFGADSAGHKRISAADAPPRPNAPYSQGVMAGDLLYLSGNIGTDPKTGKVHPAFGDAARQALDNVSKVLKAAGLGWSDVLKVNVYVKDMARYEEFNKIYTETLTAPFPARTFLAVADIPGGGQVEIEAVAARPR